jgi:hypothetical protein
MKRWRISLRLALLLFALLAVCLGWVARIVERHRHYVRTQQASIQNELQSLRWLMSHDGQDHTANIEDLEKRLEELD